MSSLKFKNQKEMFFHIWEEKPHTCDLCGVYLGEEPLAHYFSHILSKGAYPRLKLNPENIMLNCWDCHQKWDHGDATGLKNYAIIAEVRDNLRLMYNLNQI